MFTAVLIICAPILSDNCIEVVDAKGPYEKQAHCIERALQMFQDTQILFPPPYKSVSYRCDSKYKRV
jgi:hypothetical protein